MTIQTKIERSVSLIEVFDQADIFEVDGRLWLLMPAHPVVVDALAALLVDDDGAQDDDPAEYDGTAEDEDSDEDRSDFEATIDDVLPPDMGTYSEVRGC